MIRRRDFLTWLAGAMLTTSKVAGQTAVQSGRPVPTTDGRVPPMARSGGSIKLFLCGDVMTGRAIDQILPHSNDPRIYEPYLRDARDYIVLAEQLNGPIARRVPYDYVWGDALAELARMAPDVRIVNLETSITTHDEYAPKGINYRMHPRNVDVLTAAAIDCCALANNHVLDWGVEGLRETLAVLRHAGIHNAGAGMNLGQAQAPAAIPVTGKGRVLVFAFGSEYSGIGRKWAATASRAGIDLLPDFSASTVEAIATRVSHARKPGDIVVASIHWGGNWGYEIPEAHRRFARGLIDQAEVDVVHGHSSHHVKGIEVYRNRPIIYGCGDFLSDYEGIRGHREFRPDLGMMYFPTFDIETSRLLRFALIPTRIKNFRIQRASQQESDWLVQTINRESDPLGVRIRTDEAANLWLDWRSR